MAITRFGFKVSPDLVANNMKQLYLENGVSRLGLCFKALTYGPHMTIPTEVMEGRFHVPKTHPKHEVLLNTQKQLLRKVGIAEKKDMYPNQLSGGQQSGSNCLEH